MQYATYTAYIDETTSYPPIPLDDDTVPVRDDDEHDDDSDDDEEQD